MTGALRTTMVTLWCRAARVNAVRATTTSTTTRPAAATSRPGSVSNVSTIPRDSAASDAAPGTSATQPRRTAEVRVLLVHGQVTIIFVVSVCLSVCLFVQSFSQPSSIQFGSN